MKNIKLTKKGEDKYSCIFYYPDNSRIVHAFFKTRYIHDNRFGIRLWKSSGNISIV